MSVSKLIHGTSLKADRLLKRMTALKIFEKDLKEEFIASPGPGGQNVNKVSTCVVLQHIPTGRIVKCHKYRTQFANRVLAREILADMLEGLALKKRQDDMRLRAKEQARRRGRSAKGKEKMLEQKKRRSCQKANRKRVFHEDV